MKRVVCAFMEHRETRPGDVYCYAASRDAEREMRLGSLIELPPGATLTMIRVKPPKDMTGMESPEAWR